MGSENTLAVYSLPPLAFFEITPVHKHTESLILPLSVQLETPHSGKYEQPTGLFINNEFVKGAEGKTFEVINPSTEEVITSVHEATEKDIDIAVAAARKAFEGPWRKETPENRGKLIVKLANLFERTWTCSRPSSRWTMARPSTWPRSTSACALAARGTTAAGTTRSRAVSLTLTRTLSTTPRRSPLVFALRSSPGTSPFSCGHGRLARPLLAVTLSS